jgi:hypothetical protein
METHGPSDVLALSSVIGFAPLRAHPWRAAFSAGLFAGSRKAPATLWCFLARSIQSRFRKGPVLTGPESATCKIQLRMVGGRRRSDPS